MVLALVCALTFVADVHERRAGVAEADIVTSSDGVDVAFALTLQRQQESLGSRH